MQIATLGPEGTYSSEAARQYDGEAELVLAGSINEAIGMVSVGRCRNGVLPIENSIEGIVSQSLDGIFEHNLRIHWEKRLDIHHTLAGLAEAEAPDGISKIYSHPQALAQCRRYFEKHYPEADLVQVASTTAGMKFIAEEQDSTALAVGPEPAVEVYGLTMLDTEIEDEPGNETRFVAVSKTPEAYSGEELDFVLVAVVPETDRFGLIHDITGVIKDAEVNLVQLDSRPMRTGLGSYKFYMRLAMGSRDERYAGIAKGIEELGNQVVRMSV